MNKQYRVVIILVFCVGSAYAGISPSQKRNGIEARIAQRMKQIQDGLDSLKGTSIYGEFESFEQALKNAEVYKDVLAIER